MRPRDGMPVLLTTLALLAAGSTASRAQGPKTAVEFNRDVRPILADNCFKCHGPDVNQRKADLRLDVAEDAYADRGGHAAIVRGKPGESELVKRITALGKKGQMPPPKSDKKLTARQIDTLRRWIEQGGEYQKHWSLLTAKRPPVSAQG